MSQNLSFQGPSSADLFPSNAQTDFFSSSHLIPSVLEKDEGLQSDLDEDDDISLVDYSGQNPGVGDSRDPPYFPGHPRFTSSVSQHDIEQLGASTLTLILDPVGPQYPEDDTAIHPNFYTNFVNQLPAQRGPTQARSYHFNHETRASSVLQDVPHPGSLPVDVRWSHQHQHQFLSPQNPMSSSRRTESEYSSQASSSGKKIKRKEQCYICHRSLVDRDGLRYVNLTPIFIA